MLRFSTAGESHGESLVATVSGMPAGVVVEQEFIDRELWRRQQGYGRGGRMRIERDTAHILSGVRHGKTIGSPIAMVLANIDWKNWTEILPVEAGDASKHKAVASPRPGHADLAGSLKYDFPDARYVLERASARESAARVASGAIAKLLLRALVVEVVVHGLPPGVGTHANWDERMDGLLAQAVMSLQAVKAVELGRGVTAAESVGSAVHDAIGYERQGSGSSAQGSGEARRFTGFTREQNNAGGIEGGISNGEDVVVRGYLKPISTLRRPLASVSFATREPVKAAYERSDVCVVPAAGVAAEAMVALTVARLMVEKFGGDSLREMQRNFEGYCEQIRAY